MLCVYHFVLDHRLGGPHVYVDTLRKALDGKVESIVVTTGRGPMTDMTLLNLRHVWAPLYAVEMIANILWLVGAVLLGRIKREATIFNVHGGANLAPVVAARIVGIPVVWIFHETTPQFRALVAVGIWILNGHPHTLVVVANKAKEVYGLKGAELIPATVDTVFWSRDEVSDEELAACGWPNFVNVEERPFRLLAVGNINPFKGIDILLEAMAEIDGPWHLKIIGAELDTHREYAATLRARAYEIVSAKKECVVDFLGWRERTQVRALLAGTDVFVLPSRSEACPIALLEAMAMGCYCIAADVGDVVRMTENYSGSQIFPSESVESLRQNIEQMRTNYKIPNSKSDRIDGEWQLGIIAAKVLSIYSRFFTKS